MKNVFQIGGQVKGESFIGRKALIDSIRKSFIESNIRTAKSYVGLTRIGKTSLIRNAFGTSFSDNLFCVYENLKERQSYYELWQDICWDIKEMLERRGLATQELLDLLSSLIDDNDQPWIKFSRAINKIFALLSDLGIKTVLILDEFDHASTLFSEGTRHFELFRTVFSDGRFNVSAITISRRNLYTIEGATYQSSTFHGVLDIVPLKGFDDGDMREYFSVLDREGVSLSNSQKDRIIYYAGNSPYLLSIIGHYIIEAADCGQAIDVDQIFLDKCKAINDYYRDCIKHLQRDDDLKRIIPFVIGPNIGVTKNDKDELYNMGYFHETKGRLVAISEYFSDFMSLDMLKIGIWDNVINLEKRLKLLVGGNIGRIAKHFSLTVDAHSYDAFKYILKKMPDVDDGDIERYSKFIFSTKKYNNIDCSYLDVMSLTDAVKIIKHCWVDVFAEYFNNSSYDEWGMKFDKCSKARNPIAHGHEEYLTDLDKQEVDAYCKQIFTVLKDVVIETPVVKKSAAVSSNKRPEPPLLGTTVSMLIQEIRDNGEAKGLVNGNTSALILKKYVKDHDLASKIGQSIQVSVKMLLPDGSVRVEPVDS